MSRRDYVVIAHALQSAWDLTESINAAFHNRGVRAAAMYVADALAHINEGFNREAFLREACEPVSKKT